MELIAVAGVHWIFGIEFNEPLSCNGTTLPFVIVILLETILFAEILASGVARITTDALVETDAQPPLAGVV